MASKSEMSFGARLLNAEQVLTHLQSFTGYVAPATGQSAPNLKAVITAIKTQNNSTARNLQSYSGAVDERQKLFQKDDDSVEKIMSAIAATIRSVFGKNSKEAADIATMITKIRGESKNRARKDPDAAFVSQSEQSYGSITQTFADLIATLENYGTNYAPANDAITIDALKRKLAQLTEANTAVAAAYGKLKETRDDRIALYKDLATMVQRIKDAVKSQYGLRSTEYALVKGLKV